MFGGQKQTRLVREDEPGFSRAQAQDLPVLVRHDTTFRPMAEFTCGGGDDKTIRNLAQLIEHVCNWYNR